MWCLLPFFIFRIIVFFFCFAHERWLCVHTAADGGGYKPDVDALASACYVIGCVLYLGKECNVWCLTAVVRIADGRRLVCVAVAVRAADVRYTMTLCAQRVMVYDGNECWLRWNGAGIWA